MSTRDSSTVDSVAARRWKPPPFRHPTGPSVWFSGPMSQPMSTTAAPDEIAYLDAAAAATAGHEYKQRFLAALEVRAGHTVVDVGCGPGTDLARLADAVGTAGSVIGVDHDPRMVAEARRRLADRPNVELRVGDIHGLT